MAKAIGSRASSDFRGIDSSNQAPNGDTFGMGGNPMVGAAVAVAVAVAESQK